MVNKAKNTKNVQLIDKIFLKYIGFPNWIGYIFLAKKLFI